MRTSILCIFIFITTAIGCQKEDKTEGTFWEVVDPEAAGWSGDSLTFALSNAEDLPNFYSLLVIKDGKIVSEGYFNGKTESDHFHLRSISKSVISILTGIAIDQGYFSGTDHLISDIFTDYSDVIHPFMNIGHLLTMSSGVEWDEDNEVIDILEHKGGDPIDIFFSKNVIHEPGSTFNYSTLSTHILGAAIARSSDMKLEAFAKKYLFNPIGITTYQWEMDVRGKVWGSTGLQLRARDLAKIGLLIINEGVWEKNQIVSNIWINEMTQPQISISGSNSSYGYQWWLADDHEYLIVFGQGFGGQSLMLIPEKEIIIIGLQEYYVGFEISSIQWSNFLSQIFWPIYRSIY